VNFKTFYINRHQIGYQEVLLDDPVFEKAYLLEKETITGDEFMEIFSRHQQLKALPQPSME